MADWQRTLDLVEPWKQAKDRKITPQQLATTIAAKLKALKSFGGTHLLIDMEKQELASLFQDFASDDGDFDDLDDVLGDLYDWADQSLDGKFGGKKVCWIKTF